MLISVYIIPVRCRVAATLVCPGYRVDRYGDWCLHYHPWLWEQANQRLVKGTWFLHLLMTLWCSDEISFSLRVYPMNSITFGSPNVCGHCLQLGLPCWRHLTGVLGSCSGLEFAGTMAVNIVSCFWWFSLLGWAFWRVKVQLAFIPFSVTSPSLTLVLLLYFPSWLIVTQAFSVLIVTYFNGDGSIELVCFAHYDTCRAYHGVEHEVSMQW